MGKIEADLVSLTRKALDADGALSLAIPGFVVREPQVNLAENIALLIQAQDKEVANESILVAEAGTGTGKTFAYLVPAILSTKKILIATATKTLQDQLVNKDLPMLIKALGKALVVQNLKGRANYICYYRTSMYAKEGQFVTAEIAQDLHKVYIKLPSLITGERNEIVGLKEDSDAWSYTTSTADNCLGRNCPDLQKCFLMRARKRALESNVVVINHHLFFADSKLKEEGLSELLPNFDVVIFDEAHRIFEVASNFHTRQFSTRKLRYLMDDILKNWPVLDLVNQPFKQKSLELDKLVDALLISMLNQTDKLSWQKAQKIHEFMHVLDEIVIFLEELILYLPLDAVTDNSELEKCRERLIDLQNILIDLKQDKLEAIRWVEVYKHTIVMHITPFAIDSQFQQQILDSKSTFIFTSATLTVADSFTAFVKPLGIKTTNVLKFPSPFDFYKQTLLYLPRDIPDSKSKEYYPILINKVLPILKACGGRTFFLFTSHEALQKSAKILSRKISYTLLIQGDEPKSVLLDKFKTLEHAILLGTSTFWEGVDVKGESLSCVIIDKIPFLSPMDPVVQGRAAFIEKNGQNGFRDLSLPSAIIALKQGVGRLIRDVSDKGVLIIADPRLLARDYARDIFASLPSLPKTRDEQKVLSFIEANGIK